ncbi:malto-oligosyltrehalose synthase [Pedobacter sp. HMF7647]|uniref:4-alpha-glucanotransferase n=1 Tax=Hufsiella arboris TaxID=2695275 RepID=A0A7K1YAP3_9SPHI|nr:malto-oligosyltrehalose synthase [Hufsiella arboris]MXV51490.1 malto-oligosyltrehalose synthase [Hufsiella arboris]
MFDPVSTYRLQFHKDFTLNGLKKILPYLKDLGIKTIYASPIFKAVPGSNHGYDVTDPGQVNPEIGSSKELKAINKWLRENDMSWLQDIVPNHMAFDPQNTWLMDLLEKGRMSDKETFFDQGLSSGFSEEKIMVPFLGSSLQEVLAEKQLNVVYKDQRLMIKYFDAAWPLSFESYQVILSATGVANSSVTQLLEQLKKQILPEDKKMFTLAAEEIKSQLEALMMDDVSRLYIESCMNAVNNDQVLLTKVLEKQHYRLCWWKETDTKINFRRFFTVNGLICMNVQNDEVFNQSHEFIGQLVNDGIIDGLRVDHIDGLYDPEKYLSWLRRLAGDETYIVVEKILEPGEKLSDNWPVQGTTGYDFLATINNLLINHRKSKSFNRFYEKLIRKSQPVEDQVDKKKRFILTRYMSGELDNLASWFSQLRLAGIEDLQSVPAENLRDAIGEFLIGFPVYRFYEKSLPLSGADSDTVKKLFAEIVKNRAYLLSAIKLLENVFFTSNSEADPDYASRALHFFRRCMQFTGPLMAKGVEDTLMYSNASFISHNEVGDSVSSFGISVARFNLEMQQRQNEWPLALSATSTHDTKRGEDVRARLNVLSDSPDAWFEAVEEWQKLNIDLKEDNSPDLNDEYFIYQTLIGTYPMPGQDDENYQARLLDYLEKAFREAKQHSDWAEPDTKYENAVKSFARGLLNKKRLFWPRFNEFHTSILDAAIVNSLSQVMLKFTCPGVPDTYQGCEFWDLSMVDPDNRRPVDFDERAQALLEIKSLSGKDPSNFLPELWNSRYNARIKLWLVHTLLQVRKEDPDCFSKGSYIPLEVTGKLKKFAMGFARRYQQTWYLIVIPLHSTVLAKRQQRTVNELDWKDTSVIIPHEAPAHWEHLLSKARGSHNGEISLNEIFKSLPVAILKLSQPPKERSAGTLMHISSLDSSFGIGDFGPSAIAFADFLGRTCQKYWQLLPLSPTTGPSHSPYSSYSSMAGNILFISPEVLADEGCLDAGILPKYYFDTSPDRVDYQKVVLLKQKLFDIAWENFKNEPGNRADSFKQFCIDEAYWLNDFALYEVLKQAFDGKPWFDWPRDFKLRSAESIGFFEKTHQDAILKIKWLQFVFVRQWKRLKEYCNGLGIKLFGDLPFYVSHDSVDVWANPESFCLDENGQMNAVAGVPPDYFNADGQLWNMPVFRWEVLKENKFEWWVRRIRKNLERYDLLRLDHFRAFSAFWEVPAGETTAKNGQWKSGPGASLFEILKQEFGGLPFVAEDLGDIDEAVYELRDKFDLPGMKVLQFAFGDDLPESSYAPHNFTSNYFVYPGTHDNNTVAGWYANELNSKGQKKIDDYSGQKINNRNVHEYLARLALSSVAKTAIISVQDLLGLNESARLNSPASVSGNWVWRLKPRQLNFYIERQLLTWIRLYNRC